MRRLVVNRSRGGRRVWWERVTRAKPTITTESRYIPQSPPHFSPLPLLPPKPQNPPLPPAIQSSLPSYDSMSDVADQQPPAATPPDEVREPNDEERYSKLLRTKRSEFLDHLLRSLDMVAYCHFSYLYFLEYHLCILRALSAQGKELTNRRAVVVCLDFSSAQPSSSTFSPPNRQTSPCSRNDGPRSLLCLAARHFAFCVMYFPRRPARANCRTGIFTGV